MAKSKKNIKKLAQEVEPDDAELEMDLFGDLQTEGEAEDKKEEKANVSEAAESEKSNKKKNKSSDAEKEEEASASEQAEAQKAEGQKAEALNADVKKVNDEALKEQHAKGFAKGLAKGKSKGEAKQVSCPLTSQSVETNQDVAKMLLKAKMTGVL